MSKSLAKNGSLTIAISCLLLAMTFVCAQEVSFHAQGGGYVPLIVSVTTNEGKTGLSAGEPVSGAKVQLKGPRAKSKYTDGLYRISGSKKVTGDFLYKARDTDEAGFSLLYFPARWSIYSGDSFVYLSGHVVISAQGFDPVEIDISEALKDYPERRSLSGVDYTSIPTIQVTLKPSKPK